MHCKMVSSNPGLSALEISSNSPAIIPQNGSRNCQMSPVEGQNLPRLETTGLGKYINLYLSVLVLLYSCSKPSVQNPTAWTINLLIKVHIFFMVL